MAGSFVVTPAVLYGLGDAGYGGWLLINSFMGYMKLLDHPTIQRIVAGHHLKRRQRHFGAIAAHARPANRDLPAAEHDFTRHGASARCRTGRLMLIPRAADRRPG